MPSKAQHGYLLLADISGYTGFLARSELEHAQDVLSELLEIILKNLTPAFTLSEIEGDCVFVHAPEARIARGETLLELIETTYATFRDRVTAIQRRTTCTCNACRQIPTLDLKFITHHGDYMLQSVAGSSNKPMGADVIIAHRLLKNHLSETKGWHAYALFTEKALEHLGTRPDNLFEQREEYEHLKPVKTFSLDLSERYETMVTERNVFVTREQAHHSFHVDIPAPPLLVWDWLNSIEKRLLWQKIHIVPVLQINGRTNIGARNHCMHGKNVSMIETIVDWKPFDYFTTEQDIPISPIPIKLYWTHHLTPTASGTRLDMTMRVQANLPDAVKKFLPRALMMDLDYKRLGTLLAKDLQSQIASSEIRTVPATGQ